jgi:hypothetical protein
VSPLSISADFALKSLFAAFCRSFQMRNLEQRLSFIAGTKASLNARMRELNRLRDQVKKAELSAGKVRLLSRKQLRPGLRELHMGAALAAIASRARSPASGQRKIPHGASRVQRQLACALAAIAVSRFLPPGRRVSFRLVVGRASPSCQCRPAILGGSSVVCG